MAHVQVDGNTNRLKVQTNFSTLGLKPQEFLSIIININTNEVWLKQKESCKGYELAMKINDKSKDDENPINIADIFELWPYIMYFNQTKND
jgi:hypothetical protein